MLIRRIYRRGDTVMVTIPRKIRATADWANAVYVEIFFQPPRLILKPLDLETLMARPRQEGEDQVDDEAVDLKP